MSNRLSSHLLWMLVFAAAAAVWSAHVTRPVDLPNWHESDYASLARNFLREENNILYPRIDWRRDGPGYTEMEFPIIPWTAAQIYRFSGINDAVTRAISVLSMLLALSFFVKLARKFLPEPAAMAAALFFIVNHLCIYVASAHQPEPLMLALGMMSVYYFVEWYSGHSKVAYSFALLSFSGAMLLKLPMAHLGLFFLLWAWYVEGTRVFRRFSLYAFAVLALLPAFLWYAHAATFWRDFHNSSGITDQYHWIGLDLLKRPKVIANFLCLEVLFAGAGGGMLLALLAVYWNRLRTLVMQLALRWMAPIALYFVVILRTSASYWAAYYHVIAVAPLALLFGAGIARATERRVFSWRLLVGSCGMAALVLIAVFAVAEQRNSASLPGVFQDLLSAQSPLALLFIVAVLATAVSAFCFRARAGGATGVAPLSRRAVALAMAGCFSYFFISGQLLLGQWKTFANRTPEFISSSCLRALVPAGSRIVASGGICFDPGGHSVASKASNEFYWLDSKGFSTCQGQESITQLQDFAARGAEYFVAEKAALTVEPDFDRQLQRTYHLLAECSTAKLYDLRPRKYQ